MCFHVGCANKLFFLIMCSNFYFYVLSIPQYSCALKDELSKTAQQIFIVPSSNNISYIFSIIFTFLAFNYVLNT